MQKLKCLLIAASLFSFPLISHAQNDNATPASPTTPNTALTNNAHPNANNNTNANTNNKPIMVDKTTQQFTISLPANRTTGYSWFLLRYNHFLLTPIKHQYLAPDQGTMGAPGMEEFTFKVISSAYAMPQITNLKFVYKRPWEASVNNGDKNSVFTIVIQ